MAEDPTPRTVGDTHGWANTGPAGKLEPLHRPAPPRQTRLAEPLVEEVERLRAVACALEEECAARAEDAERLALALDNAGGGAYSSAIEALEAHDALVDFYSPGGPSTLPEAVEGATGDAGGESTAMRRAGEDLAAILTLWATPATDPEDLAEAREALAAWDDALGIPEAERCPVGPAVGEVTVECTDSWAQFGEQR